MAGQARDNLGQFVKTEPGSGVPPTELFDRINSNTGAAGEHALPSGNLSGRIHDAADESDSPARAATKARAAALLRIQLEQMEHHTRKWSKC